MFIDPAVAIVVTIGTFFGFFMSFPLVIALRAASHIVFVVIGAYYLKYQPGTLKSPAKSQIFSFFIALIHAASEVLVVYYFYFNGSLAGYNSVKMVGLLLGLGSIVHSMVDFGIAYIIYQALRRVRGLGNLFLA
jgi:niacin transporter